MGGITCANRWALGREIGRTRLSIARELDYLGVGSVREGLLRQRSADRGGRFIRPGEPELPGQHASDRHQDDHPLLRPRR